MFATPNEIETDAKTRMGKSIDALSHELKSIRTGRANAGILDKIKVPYYGTPTPLSQVANVSTPDARALLIKAFDKTMIGPIEKALMASDLGITPTTIGMDIRLNFPPPTEERRKELAKSVAGKGEDAKIAIRNIRREANQHIEKLLKDKTITEDDKTRADDGIQKITDQFVKKVDDAVKEKEKELMAL
ncbi:ribosome recycling factor [Luteibacter rhizovicinus]|uniref:Ribosome-recycling factor n=1 Tax=Luteibacter rhizovicinus TaxID=242606 RepID=A0A4R3YI40_9GAMM|nr:ribosome recycling factor [Luteibacter rhizovicinus]TCV91876.1 ribosome recycling factor [Luteibacter rhizovicinus]